MKLWVKLRADDCTALFVGIFERICCFNEVFLMAPTSTKQLFVERPLFPVTSVKKFLCNVIGFTIFHLSEAATGGVLLEKEFSEISQNSQENTCGEVFF